MTLARVGVGSCVMRGERLLPLIASERTLRGLLLLAAGIYLLPHAVTP
jgi:hypothetical protein